MRELPQSIEAEVAVLGTLLVYPETTITVSQYGLVPSDFFKREHQIVFTNMLQVIDDRANLDVTTLVTKLQDNNVINDIGGFQYLVYLTNGSGSPSSLDYYVDIVQEKAQKRNLIAATQAITESGFDTSVDVEELLEKAERSIKEIAMARRTEDMLKGADVVDQVYNQIKEFSQRGTKITGLHTGFHDINRMTNGLQKGDLIILAARPSVGKTAFALNLAMNVTKYNKDRKAGVAIFSLEMPATHLITRMLSAESGVHGTTLRNGKLTDDEWNQLNTGIASLRPRNIFIDDSSSITVPEMYAKCRKLKDEDMLDIIVIDYIQLISVKSRSDNRQLDVSEISRGLKQMARDLEVPVIALSQLSRAVEKREGNMPQLSDLRESGSLEQDADIVMFLYREAYHDQENKSQERVEEDTTLLIRKHRNGGLGDIQLKFKPKINQFISVESGFGSDD